MFFFVCLFNCSQLANWITYTNNIFNTSLKSTTQALISNTSINICLTLVLKELLCSWGQLKVFQMQLGTFNSEQPKHCSQLYKFDLETQPYQENFIICFLQNKVRNFRNTFNLRTKMKHGLFEMTLNLSSVSRSKNELIVCKWFLNVSDYIFAAQLFRSIYVN